MIGETYCYMCGMDAGEILSLSEYEKLDELIYTHTIHVESMIGCHKSDEARSEYG